MRCKVNLKIKLLEKKTNCDDRGGRTANAWNIIRDGRHSLRVGEAGTLRKIHHSLQNRSFESMCTRLSTFKHDCHRERKACMKSH